jgi:hypothetical protein
MRRFKTSAEVTEVLAYYELRDAEDKTKEVPATK